MKNHTPMRNSGLNENRLPRSHAQHGFTLVEMAIVLIIFSLLVGGMLMTLTSQQDIANIKETETRLHTIQEALIGYATANGRLPCPAAPPPAGGTESPPSTGVCTNALQTGYVPAALLGVAPTDDKGYALDAWNNPVRYAVVPNSITMQTPPFTTISNPFTTPGAIKTLTIETISLSAVGPPPTQRTFLYVCASATGIGTTNCGTAQQITDSAIALVYSTGKNGADETRGGADDIVFISAQASGGFDDQSIWISPNILFNRMIAAGRLP